jgi:hypothetical protein
VRALAVVCALLASIVAASGPAVAEAELSQSVATKTSRADLSRFLIAPGERATKARAWA